MTFRVIIGIDPGQTGALAVLADGVYDTFGDMPTKERKSGGEEIDGAALAQSLRSVRRRHAGADFLASLELVSAMPGKDGKGGRQAMGASSAFRFGEGFGVIKGVLQTLGIPYRLVTPLVWKRHFGLIGEKKAASRALAIKLFPDAAGCLTRVKDEGRAEALLMAEWAQQNGIVVPRSTTLEESDVVTESSEEASSEGSQEVEGQGLLTQAGA